MAATAMAGSAASSVARAGSNAREIADTLECVQGSHPGVRARVLTCYQGNQARGGAFADDRQPGDRTVTGQRMR